MLVLTVPVVFTLSSVLLDFIFSLRKLLILKRASLLSLVKSKFYLLQCYLTTDIEPPNLTYCPEDIVKEGTEIQERVHWERPTFTDNSGKPVTISSNRQSGDFFSVPGSYEVVYTASDDSGNTNKNCTFRITLRSKLLQIFYRSHK